MCIAQKHFNKFNKQEETCFWEENPADNLLCPFQNSAISTIARLNRAPSNKETSRSS